MKAYLIIIALFLTNCGGGLSLKTHTGILSPNVYELTDGTVSIKYYNGQCCCIAKQVLQEVKNRVESGTLDWSKMKDENFSNKYLHEVCKELRERNESNKEKDSE